MRAPKFWTTKSFLGDALSPLGAVYALAGRAKQTLASPYRAGARVICVGNLTAGGTGKTPIALAIAQMLRAKGRNAVFLTRGYGGRVKSAILCDPSESPSYVGDEALLLAAHAPTIVSPDRAEGARLADKIGADVIIMDDGFQNFSLAKDLSILVIDGETVFGNGHVIPAGPLREPVGRGIARADAMIVMGGNLTLPASIKPLFKARLVPTAPEALKGIKAYAFAGIGRPEKFFTTLKEMGVEIVGSQAFSDHHRFSNMELHELRALASKLGAVLVTTEKDYVRLAPEERKGMVAVPVHAVIENVEMLHQLLDRLIQPPHIPGV